MKTATQYDERTSIPGLIKGLLDDARDLVREEIQLARAEIREEVSALGAVAVAFAVAAVVGLLGAMLFSVALGGALAYFLRWPPWAGYGLVALMFLAGGWGLCLYARGRLRTIRAIPNTTETMKENLTWMQNKSGLR
jgi:cytochrome b